MAKGPASILRQRYLPEDAPVSGRALNKVLSRLEKALTFNDGPDIKVDYSEQTGARWFLKKDSNIDICRFQVVFTDGRIYVRQGTIAISNEDDKYWQPIFPYLAEVESPGKIDDLPAPYEKLANLDTGSDYVLLLIFSADEAYLKFHDRSEELDIDDDLCAIEMATFRVGDNYEIEDFKQLVCSDISLCCDKEDTSSSSSSSSSGSGGFPPFGGSSGSEPGSSSGSKPGSGSGSTPGSGGSGPTGGPPEYYLNIQCVPSSGGTPTIIPVPVPTPSEGKYQYFTICSGMMNGNQTFSLNLEREEDCPTPPTSSGSSGSESGSTTNPPTSSGSGSGPGGSDPTSGGSTSGSGSGSGSKTFPPELFLDCDGQVIVFTHDPGANEYTGTNQNATYTITWNGTNWVIEKIISVPLSVTTATIGSDPCNPWKNEGSPGFFDFVLDGINYIPIDEPSSSGGSEAGSEAGSDSGSGVGPGSQGGSGSGSGSEV